MSKQQIKINIPNFNIAKTFECGQCFRWNRDEHGVYAGVAFGRAAALRQAGSNVYITCSSDDYETIWRDYFDLNRDYTELCGQLCISSFMRSALDFGKGIRMLRQEPWEALCSFILSQNNNIPRIKKLIDSLCRRFGNPLEFNGNTLYTFPSADKLAKLCEDDLAPLRCGYRAGYLLSAAGAVAGGSLNPDALSALPADTVRKKLKQLPGVGDKVADCVMLYGLHMTDAFPVDVWIRKALSEHLGEDFDPSVFSPYAGIAQLYIFYYMRNGI